MKVIFILLLLSGLFFNGCKIKTEQPQPFMHAKKGSMTFNFNRCVSMSIGNFIVIQGFSSVNDTVFSSYPMMQLWLWKFKAEVSTLNLDGKDSSMAFWISAPEDTIPAVNGSISITSVNPDYSFRGRFKLTCADSTVVLGENFFTYPWFDKI